MLTKAKGKRKKEFSSSAIKRLEEFPHWRSLLSLSFSLCLIRTGDIKIRKEGYMYVCIYTWKSCINKLKQETKPNGDKKLFYSLISIFFISFAIHLRPFIGIHACNEISRVKERKREREKKMQFQWNPFNIILSSFIILVLV
jgi:hypothetical protein